MRDVAKPRITVVIPFLNGDNYIRDAVASVFAQEGAHWELLLIDDGSVDASADYAKKLASRDKRVRRLAHPGEGNRGIVRSRRLGLQAARGEYVLFLDHDDMLLPNALAQMVDMLDKHPEAGAVFAGTRHRHIREGKDTIDFEFDFAPFPTGVISRGKLARDMIRSDSHHPQPSSSLWRKESLLAVDRTIPIIKNSIYGDSALALSLLTLQDVCVLNRPASIYRIHGDSMCAAGERDGTYGDTPWSQTRLAFLREAKAALPLDATQRLYLSAAITVLTALGGLATVARRFPRPLRGPLRAILGMNTRPNLRSKTVVEEISPGSC